MNTTFKQLTHLAVVASLCFAAAGSFAQAEQGKRSEMRKLDTNGDKLISRDEAKANPMLSKNFDAIDANKDGQLSRDEIKAFHKAHKIDQDGDGNISRAEAAKNPKLAKHFEEIDTNKDGIITPAERKAWMDKRKKV
jgi:Ca2+-binding EF-hand superfamily protein